MGSKEDYAKVGVDLSEFDNGDLKFDDYHSIPPMFFTREHATVPFVDRFPNSHGFIIASGPSLNSIDKSKLNHPGILTMGINNSARVVRPKMWTCVDPPEKFLLSVWRDPTIEKIVPMSHMDKKLFDSVNWKEVNQKVGECPNVFYYRRNGVMNTENGHWLYENTVNWGNHSEIGGGRSVFITAIRIMFLMGVRRLYLVGADFYMDEKNKYAFPQDRNRGSINGNNATYGSMNKWFGQLRKHFEEVNFHVYNCNHQSKLTAFDFIDFNDAFKAALKDFPDYNKENTDGLYTREDEIEKKQKEDLAKREAAKYTDEDRKKIKALLDEKRKALDVAKLKTQQARARMRTPMSEEAFKIIYEKALKNNEFPIEPDIKLAVEARVAEQKIREDFRATNIEKNKIWGIAK